MTDFSGNFDGEGGDTTSIVHVEEPDPSDSIGRSSNISQLIFRKFGGNR